MDIVSQDRVLVDASKVHVLFGELKLIKQEFSISPKSHVRVGIMFQIKSTE